MIPTLNEYEEFVAKILDSGFKKTKHKYRVIYLESNTVVDILPKGGLLKTTR